MFQDLSLRIAATLALAASLAVSISYRSRADRRGGRVSEREEGTLLLTLRSIFGSAGWLAVFLYLAYPPALAWSSLPLPLWLRWGGLAIMVACVPLVYWLFSSLGDNVTRTVATRKEHTLVTHGPYRWVRHPLYTTGFLMLAGFSLVAANWFIALLLGVAFTILAIRTPLEEARLIERFGDEYRGYMQRTGRYLPKI